MADDKTDSVWDTLAQELMPTPMMGWNGWLPTTMLHTGYSNNETMCT